MGKLHSLYSNDFYFEIARANQQRYDHRTIIGQNGALAGAAKFIWGQGTVASQDLTEATTAAVVCISSSNQATDVNKSVTITGVNANYDEIVEVINTNATDGRTKVTGTKAFLAINSVTIPAALSGKLYVYYNSAITAGVPDDLTKVQAVIDIGSKQSFNAFYCVPRNKNLYMSNFRYTSTGSTTKNDVVITIKRKLFGGSYVDLDTIKYTDLSTTFVDGQVDFMYEPIIFPAKSKFKITGGLAGGTALDITIKAKFVEETITALPTTTNVINLATYLKTLTTRSTTIASQNYFLIGLNEFPTTVISSFNLDDTLTIITGATNYRVAANTEVAFDAAYFISGKLISTDKKAMMTVMRCVDSGGNVDFVLAPVHTFVELGSGSRRVNKISYLA